MSGYVVQVVSHDPEDAGGDTLYGPFRSERAAEEFAARAAKVIPDHETGWNPTWVRVRAVSEPTVGTLGSHGWTGERRPREDDQEV